MKNITAMLTLLLFGLATAGCAPGPRDPYNTPDSQRDRAGQSQDEMRRDTSY